MTYKNSYLPTSFFTFTALILKSILGSVKQLAGQTMWYGLSSIAARFINYLLTPYLTGVLTKADYGKMGLVYAAIPLFNVLFTYGLETAYFRFSHNKVQNPNLYATSFISIFCSTCIFATLLWLNVGPLSHFAGLVDYPQLIRLSIVIISLDTLCVIPFARLRQMNRPKKFAFLKIAGILVNIFLTIFFLSYCHKAMIKNHDSWVRIFYDPTNNPIVYVVWANVVQNIITFLLLWKEISLVRFNFDFKLWKEIMAYTLPLIIVGMGGVVNETFDRLMLKWWAVGSNTFKEEQVGIYNACYKLSILITLFVQAFKMGAEPFFFKQAQGQNPQRTYARVMKFFVITISAMFLVVTLFIPVWQHFIDKKFWDGLSVVPILLLANMFLGIYYNLSIWYKLGNKTKAGATITIIGAFITLIINASFIPFFSYMASAWATFFCYGSMMVISFVWGQKEYRIPYAWKKLTAFMVIAVLVFWLHNGIDYFIPNKFVNFLSGMLLLAIYCLFIFKVEKKEFAKLPVIGKWVK